MRTEGIRPPALIPLLVAALLFRGLLPPAAHGAEAKPRPSEGKGGRTGTLAHEEIEIKGKKRAYRLVAPKSLDPKTPAPLVFAFHGLLDSKDLMPLYSQLDKLAEEKGFVLIYPNGVNRAWPLVMFLARNDLAFFDALLAHAASNYNIDLNRVYLTGMSNGAYFSQLVASERSEKVAAIAAHSGGLGFLAAAGVNVKQKYGVMLIHGDADSIVPVAESRKARDACKKWGHEVEYVEVPGLNHFWAHKADINAKIWEFFKAHPLRAQ